MTAIVSKTRHFKWIDCTRCDRKSHGRLHIRSLLYRERQYLSKNPVRRLTAFHGSLGFALFQTIRGFSTSGSGSALKCSAVCSRCIGLCASVAAAFHLKAPEYITIIHRISGGLNIRKCGRRINAGQYLYRRSALVSCRAKCASLQEPPGEKAFATLVGAGIL